MKFYIFFILTLIPISSVIGLNDLRSFLQSLQRRNERGSNELLEKVSTEEHSKENTKSNQDLIDPEGVNLVDNEKHIVIDKYNGGELLNNKLDPLHNNDDDGVEKPGLALIQPDLDMLESAAKFTKPSVNNAVYGNLNSLGITYGNTHEMLLNTNFRKQYNSLLKQLLKDSKIDKNKHKREDPTLVIIKTYDDNDSEDNLPLHLTYNTRRRRNSKGTLRQRKMTSDEEEISQEKEEIVEESEGLDEETEENDEQVLSDKIDDDNESGNENVKNENDYDSEEDETGQSKKLNLGMEMDERNNYSSDESEEQKSKKSKILDFLTGKGKKSQKISEANENGEEIIANKNIDSKSEEEETNTDKENTEENDKRTEETKTSDYVEQSDKSSKENLEDEEETESNPNGLSKEELLESKGSGEETKISSDIEASEETDERSDKEEETTENNSNPVSSTENTEENAVESEESNTSNDIASEENGTESKKKQNITKLSDKLEGSGAVYGNLDNLGITYGKTRERLLNTNFRRNNPLMSNLLTRLQIMEQQNNQRKPSLVFIEIYDDKDATVNSESSDAYDTLLKTRRASFSDESSSKETSGSYETEKNPGNKYTVFKDKYKQNWLWNYEMDGNHMNINPYAPSFGSMDALGPSLFYGRKWWYFNQDDYVPLH